MDKLYTIKREVSGKGAFCLLKRKQARKQKKTKQEQGYWVEL